MMIGYNSRQKSKRSFVVVDLNKTPLFRFSVVKLFGHKNHVHSNSEQIYLSQIQWETINPKWIGGGIAPSLLLLVMLPRPSSSSFNGSTDIIVGKYRIQ